MWTGRLSAPADLALRRAAACSGLASRGRLARGGPPGRRTPGRRAAAGAAAHGLRGVLEILLDRLAQLAAVALDPAERLLKIAVGRLRVAVLRILGERTQALLQRLQRPVERRQAPRLARRGPASRGPPCGRLASCRLASGRGL